MKKLLLGLFVMLFSIMTLSAADKKIDMRDLPKKAQTFISANYKKDKITRATVDRDRFDTDYKVILASGVNIEFDAKGEWTEIECRRNGDEIPKNVVPTKIARYVKERFPSRKIVKIERDNRSTEVELNNGKELRFNSRYELIR